jgi:hypothetical protein
MMKSTLPQSILAATRGRSFRACATAQPRKAIVRGLIVMSLALAAGCALEPMDGGYDGSDFYGAGFVDGGFYDGFHDRFQPGAREDRRDGDFHASREGEHEVGGHEGGEHEGGGHEGGGGHGGGGHR